ncbi:hypothetical protein Bhyg_14319, partial [Pseudolycoriella hygida]
MNISAMFHLNNLSLIYLVSVEHDIVNRKVDENSDVTLNSVDYFVDYFEGKSQPLLVTELIRMKNTLVFTKFLRQFALIDVKLFGDSEQFK